MTDPIYTSFARPDFWYDEVRERFRRTEIAPLALKFASPEVTLVDAGSNRGSWTWAFCGAVDGHVTAHLFEPSAANISESQLRLQPLTEGGHTLHHVQAALGLASGRAELYSAWEGSFTASLVPGIEREANASLVKIQTLDDYARAAAIPRIDFLKLDVEGFELEVLKGAGTLLAENRIDRIFWEFSSANSISRIFFRDFYMLLSEEFDLYYLRRPNEPGKSAHLVKIEGYQNGRWEKFWGTHYFYAIRKGCPTGLG